MEKEEVIKQNLGLGVFFHIDKIAEEEGNYEEN